ncbi:HpcH/HpaI aldolase family protein [Azotobacter beijerinckii]|uniref:4-hydroxy-2-oxoheptanedioate aldolase n=1 Tax=Azotobacter beijerinckii TaxID=170623 RepID=A0A1I4DEI4_9GAMM|nr:aldolase/citrate lyase family protein [Azotobacter beijerinckii]SFB34966.1 4-hydroxy-2-oxoheptanedioate aldolase [Azotobacter beijerinckii]SFK91453.1 4-hydroxy-2-oxoheptanedioate aldolase [Azotobacter beijerinckii]
MLRQSVVFARLRQGDEVFGLLNSVPSPLLCEMIAAAGYHFAILDMEHLLRSGDELMHCLRACESAGLAPWLRVPEVDEKLIGRALDAGVEAIVLPRVESAAEVERAIAAACFPPRGRRGISGGRVTGFGALALPDYIALANGEPRIVPMIESAAGLAALPEILALPGVAMVLEGALDLALDLQLGPEPTHPQVWQALQSMAAACADAGVPFCANPRTPEQIRHWRSQGIRSFLAGEDRGLLLNALKSRLNSFQSPTEV